MNKGQPRKPDEWGVLAAWSWGISRAMDYFETDKSVDARQVGLDGHSRWGKEALIAMAFDQRIAIAYSSCSGAMGASLEKRNWGETIDNVGGSGEIAFRMHNGGHTDAPDWPLFLEFAARYLKKGD